jgi:HK97 family phage prohead protease
MSKAIDKARRAAARAEVQKRVFTARPEVRAAKEDDESAGTVTGHAAVFDTPSQPIYDWWEGMFVEEVRAGAFLKTIAEADIRFLINHDPNLILARNKGGTLRLAEDEIGLAIDADLAATSYGRDLATSMRRGDVTQMSIMFARRQGRLGGHARRDAAARDQRGQALRRLGRDLPRLRGDRHRDALARRGRAPALARPGRRAGRAARQPDRRPDARHPIPDDLAPVLRAAQRALGELATNIEPAEGHSTRSLAQAQERLRLAAKRWSLSDVA